MMSHIASEFLYERVELILIETCSLGNSYSDLQHICSAHCEMLAPTMRNLQIKNNKTCIYFYMNKYSKPGLN